MIGSTGISAITVHRSSTSANLVAGCGDRGDYPWRGTPWMGCQVTGERKSQGKDVLVKVNAGPSSIPARLTLEIYYLFRHDNKICLLVINIKQRFPISSLETCEQSTLLSPDSLHFCSSKNVDRLAGSGLGSIDIGG